MLTQLIQCTVLLAAVSPPAEDQATIAIVGSHVITMDGGRIIPDATVVIEKGRIQDLGAADEVRVPEGARVITASGQWMLPGLTDMHVHIGHESELLLYLRYGVTSICNLGGDGLDLFTGERLDVLDLRRRIRTGELAGPDVYSAGTALDGDPATGPYQTPVPDAQAALRLVGEQIEAGFDFIKVYDALPGATHAAIVRAAQNGKKAVFGHVPEALGVEATLTSGQAVIAHAEEYFDAFERVAEQIEDEFPRLARLTREANVAVIPNTSFILNVLLQLDDLQARLDRPQVRFIAPSVRRWWEPRYNYLLTKPDLDAFGRQMREKYSFVHGLTRALQDEGVLLLAGSDASVPTAVPGLSLHEELRDLESAGLTLEQSLMTATANVRTFFEEHLPSEAVFGTLAVGSRANLLLLDGDPLDSLSSLDGVLGVMVRGRWYERAELDARLEEAAAGFGQ